MSSNQLSKFDALQNKAVKWINRQQFNHYTELEYLSKLKELSILPIKAKFALNDIILCFFNYEFQLSYLSILLSLNLKMLDSKGKLLQEREGKDSEESMAKKVKLLKARKERK